MTTTLPLAVETSFFSSDDDVSRVARVAAQGLLSHPRRLPAWLFYDAEGSRLFDAITELPEYYLTRTERAIFRRFAAEIVARAAEGRCLRVAELGAGSAEKTRLLLAAATALQGEVVYEPVDVSPTALEAARQRIESELPGVTVAPCVGDYTDGLEMGACSSDERRLVLYIGSSIGNFEPQAAQELLAGVRAGLKPGDSLLLGVDCAKDEATLVAAYDDAAGVTAAFNRNMLARLNRELAMGFRVEDFAHVAVWNATESRMEMHLECGAAQVVRLPLTRLEGSGFVEIGFAVGDRIHTENSYKYAPGQAEALLTSAGFTPEAHWTDERGWFSVHLARVGG